MQPFFDTCSLVFLPCAVPVWSFGRSALVHPWTPVNNDLMMLTNEAGKTLKEDEIARFAKAKVYLFYDVFYIRPTIWFGLKLFEQC